MNRLLTIVFSSSLIFLFACCLVPDAGAENVTMDDFHALVNARYQEWMKIQSQCPYTPLATDYFLRFSKDPEAKPEPGETVLDENWRILLPEGCSHLTEKMAGHFAQFMDRVMGVSLQTVVFHEGEKEDGKSIRFIETGGGDSDIAESFTIRVQADSVQVWGRDKYGLRDGIVRLVDKIAMRRAPFLSPEEQVYRPRIPTRLGGFHASAMYTVFMGYNAVIPWSGCLYSISESDAIPELAARRREGFLDSMIATVRQAKEYGLKTFLHLNTMEKFPADDPVLLAHPEIRGTMTWREGGDYTICTEHPLVKKFLMETIEGIFQATPGLDGIIFIIGGEGTYHCFMRPYGTENGHTNCARCEELGPDYVVANLCNYLAEAARKHNPEAVIYAWPYSADAVWSSDKPHTGFIRNLKPGAGILTEMVKDEVMEKEGGIQKRLWDYSIDMIGPGDRAREQARLCREVGIPICLLSMAEGTFEASFLPGIPCMDRWMDRADALVHAGADMAYIWQIGPFHGMPSTEVYRLNWWDPVPEKEALLEALAARIAGPEAGPRLREAWRHVSEAIEWVPEIGPYYLGPQYLGPAHPMIADRSASVPEVFYGYYLFFVEMTAEDALKGRPTYITEPRGADPVLFGRYFDKKRDLLEQAAEAMDRAQPLVPEECRLLFEAESHCIYWFYRTARTESNFTRSCLLRDELTELALKNALTEEELVRARNLYESWREVLLDEKENTKAALPLAEADPRLNFYFRGDHSFPHVTDMIREKMKILDHELNEFLPSLARKAGILED